MAGMRFSLFAEDFQADLETFAEALAELTDIPKIMEASIQGVTDVFTVMEKRSALMAKFYSADFLSVGTTPFYRLVCNRSEYVVGILLDKQPWFPTNELCPLTNRIPTTSTATCYANGCCDALLVECRPCKHLICE